MKLCDKSDKSTYIIDRIRLNGEASFEEDKNKVLILEFDESLSYLLKNVCELNNIRAKTVNNYMEFNEIYEEYNPEVVILDWGKDKETESLMQEKLNKIIKN